MSIGVDDQDKAVLDVEDRFAIVPKWVLDAAISDAAVRLYAVLARKWPAAHVQAALLSVAADPATRSPMRLTEAGPWWDEPVARDQPAGDVAELAAMEADLCDAGGLRVALQRQAREQLAAEGAPTTRATVTRRAHELLGARVIDTAGETAC